MSRLLFISLLGIFAASVSAQQRAVPFITPNDVEAWKAHPSDTVFVLNFWATWCGPCVAELPAFERITSAYADQPVQVVLISTDFRKQVEKSLIPFVAQQNLRSRVVFMNDPNAAKWINQVSTAWTGSIPATLIVSKRRGVFWFHEGQLTYKKLNKQVKKALKKRAVS